MVYAASIGDEFTDLLGNVVNVAVKVADLPRHHGAGLVRGPVAAQVAAPAACTGSASTARSNAAACGRLLGATSASDLTARLVDVRFLLFVLQLAFGIFGPNPVSDLIAGVIAWLPKLFVAVVIVVVAAAIAGWVSDLITQGLGGLSYGRAIATSAQVVRAAARHHRGAATRSASRPRSPCRCSSPCSPRSPASSSSASAAA